MEKKKAIGIMVISYCLVFLTGICLAETYTQTNGLFKIDVPEGWHWLEEPGDIWVKNPEENNGISIQFAPMAVVSKNVALETSIQGIKLMVKTLPNGTVLAKTDTSIDGIYAKQLDYLFSFKGEEELQHGTYICFFTKGYAFTISFGAKQDSEERLEMEKIVETFQFQ